MLALASYLRQVETGDKNATGQILWSKATAPFSVSKDKPLVTASFPIVNQTAAEPIRLTKSGGQIFSEVTVEARPKLIEQPRQDRGYSITRRYSKLGDDGKLTAAENLRVGDRVLVTLDIEVRRRGDLSRGGGSVARRVRSDQSRVQVAGSCRRVKRSGRNG